ncbi:helix-turn-helix domain-containing protein [Eubacterium limosum]|uniref:helix-turn-helix domain-containing protein n=1 Tax=Eubacterium limosum TaxID=1736 RepID=UPI00370F9B8F
MIYKKINELSVQKGISVKALEKKLHFGNGTISRWKTAEPGADKLRKVANYLGVSVDYLLSNNPTELSPTAYLVAKYYDQLDEKQKEIVNVVLNEFEDHSE